ncbi:MAG TPA: diadenylate cyclase CdaA [Oligoflexia bacterium]|nr:diadenylate cyclase CdaA [Oligoflexia bacterium]
MTELLATIGDSVRPIDLLDIAVVSYIVYRALLLIKGTRAVQMLTGLGILGIAFMISIKFELFTLHWILSYFFDSLILLVIVLFQDEIRRALTYMGKNPFFSSSSTAEEIEIIDEISRAAARLARERIGALIVIERETGLKNFIDTGSKIEAKVRSELLYSIFTPTSPIHDGAAIISEGRIAAAGCFLPLSNDPNIEKKLGTRHRAAFGLSEETDAIVILVSEEAGEAHLVRNGKMTTNLSEEELRGSLMAILELYDGSRIGRIRLRSFQVRTGTRSKGRDEKAGRDSS